MTNPPDKKARIVVCDPGVGNVRSVVRAIELAASRVAASLVITRDASVVRDADVVVVPGQGAFGPFVRGVAGGLADALREHLAAKKPYLGICLGMQVLFESSEEATEEERGLGHFSGRVRRLAPGTDPLTGQPYALPHIGWNAVDTGTEAATQPHFYFAHTFAAAPDDDAIVAGRTEYGAARFASMVQKDNVLGVQFHPEKSQLEGQRLLMRFFETNV